MHRELGAVLPGLWVVFLVNVLFWDQLNNAVQAANTTSPNTSSRVRPTAINSMQTVRKACKGHTRVLFVRIPSKRF